MSTPLLPDALWNLIQPLLSPPPRKPNGGRPRLPDRACFTGILFVLRSGTPWEMSLGGTPPTIRKAWRVRQTHHARSWLDLASLWEQRRKGTDISEREFGEECLHRYSGTRQWTGAREGA